MVGIGSSGAVNVTSINLSSAAGAGRKGPSSTEDILKHIELTLSDVHQNERFKQEELDARILGKCVAAAAPRGAHQPAACSPPGIKKAFSDAQQWEQHSFRTVTCLLLQDQPA